MLQVSMLVYVDVCPREPASIDETRMAKLVAEDDVAFGKERLKGSGVGRVAARKDQRGGQADEVGECGLGLQMDVHRARYEAGCTGSESGAFEAASCGLNQGRVVGEAEVVV